MVEILSVLGIFAFLALAHDVMLQRVFISPDPSIDEPVLKPEEPG